MVLHRLPVAVEPGLVLGAQHRHPGLEVRQAVADVMHEQPAQSFSQVAGAGPGGQRGVVALQESVLILHGVLQALLGIDVMLAPWEDYPLGREREREGGEGVESGDEIINTLAPLRTVKPRTLQG